MDRVQQTPLYETHKALGGKIIDFAGWALPVQYEGIIEEHEAVRQAAGIFDVSHMGEVTIKGPEAQKFVQYLVTNDISKLNPNQVIYTMMCYEDGGVVDDLLVYHLDDNDYYLVINASNVEKDYEWMLKQSASFDCELENISHEIGEVAIQGPHAQAILQKQVAVNLDHIGFFYCQPDIMVDGVKCLISRTGYTGEDGFEVYAKADEIVKVWKALMEAGEDLGLKPAGLGARDTLRFEANLPLYGNEISESITPLEAGLGFFVKLDKDQFIGKEALQKQKEAGLKRKIVGFEMEKGIPRHGYDVLSEGKVIGMVTTGYFSPTLKKNIGLALIESEYAKMGNALDIQIRKRVLPATIVSKRFYQKNYKK